ncbi:condensation domain-containing protein [Streptomyces kronopolitis]|uniref:condensation domain-containing protein n=1 Tax=Streptomyces kronopolitis TaxID=1612435 RepID=UPI0036777BFB
MPETAEHLPLTSYQKLLWGALQPGCEPTLCNLSQELLLEGDLDSDALRAAFRQTMSETEAMRTRVMSHNGAPCQVVAEAGAGDLAVVDLRSEPAPLSSARAQITSDAARSWDLRSEPPVISTLYKVSDKRFVWGSHAHHLLIDGAGMELVHRRMREIYSDLLRGLTPTDRPPARLRTLIREEAAYRSSTGYYRDRFFWSNQLNNFRDPCRLTPLATPNTPLSPARRLQFQLTSVHSRALRGTARRYGTGWQAAMVAALAALVQLTTGTRDSLLNMATSARSGPAAKRTPGMAANTVPLRLTIAPGSSLAELVQQSAIVVKTALRHRRFPVSALFSDTRNAEELGLMQGPYINIMPSVADRDLPGATVRTSQLYTTRFCNDVNLDITLVGDAFSLTLLANPDSCCDERLGRLADQLVSLLSRLAWRPGSRL